MLEKDYIDQLNGEREHSNQRDLWNKRAQEFYEYTKENPDRVVLDFIEDRIDLEGCNILDIGCGAGRFLIPFVKAGANVIGIDIADEMLKYAEIACDEEGIPKDRYELIRCDWKEIKLEDMGWNKKFDLVFASMSPGIREWDTVEKLIGASKSYVYISSFIFRKERVYDLIKKDYPDKEETDWKIRFRAILNLLLIKGYYPDLKFQRRLGEKDFDPEASSLRYAHRFLDDPEDDTEINELRDRLEKIAMDIGYKNTIDRVVGMMLFHI
ncbi:MAG: methyltransferase domain-containing protein [Tissierellia bacterium]|nr:methyltransferase domain-containing protein [Tissierellia bacterium]